MEDQFKTKNVRSRSLTILMLLRWWYVTLYGVLSSLIVWGVLKSKFGDALFQSVVNLNPSVLWPMDIVLAVAVIGLFWKLQLFKFRHISTWLNHPPLLASMLLSTVLMLIYEGKAGAIAFLTGSSLALIFCFMESIKTFKAKSVSDCIIPPLLRDTVLSLGQKVSDWDKDTVNQWVERELPVDEGQPLLFGYEHYVADIYSKLIATKDGQASKAKTMALVGELGSGKSSIFKVLKSQLKDPWVVVEVDAWSREASSLDEQILELIIEKLAEYTDVTGYRGLPKQYHRALEAKRGWYAFFSILSEDSADTDERLKRIEDLLSLIQKKLLVIVEDPDRGEPAKMPERMSRVLSLVDRIKQSNGSRVKVVVSCGVEALSSDYRAVEFKTVIETPSKEFADITNKMVELWCPQHELDSGTLILPNGIPKFTADLFPKGTPRDFKHALRDVTALWDGPLRGEIDLELLVLLSFVWELQYTNKESLVFEYIKAELDRGFGQRAHDHYSWGQVTNYTGEINRRKKEEADKKRNDDSTRLVDLEARIARLESNDIRAEDLYARMSPDEKRLASSMMKAIGRLDKTALQTAKSGNRINYIQRFLDRHSETRWGQDVNHAKLVKEEKLKDQQYLQAMYRLVQNLSLSESAISFKNSDLEKLLYSSGLSKYFYDLLREKLQGADQLKKIEVWHALTLGFIECLESFKYTKNEEGNPVAPHLLESLNELKKLEANQLALELFLNAISTDSSAGLEAIALAPYYGMVINDLGLGATWLCISEAVFNSTLSDQNLGAGKPEEDISWRFLKYIQDNGMMRSVLDTHKRIDEPLVSNARSIEAINRLETIIDSLMTYTITMTSAHNDFAYQHDAKRWLVRDDRTDDKDSYIAWLKTYFE